jgi:hypothetical protein
MKRPTASVVAQQYSSATFVSLLLLSRKEKLGATFKSIISIFLLFFNFPSLKLCNLKFELAGECLYVFNFHSM